MRGGMRATQGAARPLSRLPFGGGARLALPPLAIFFILAATLALAFTFPALTGRVTDQANIIPEQTRAALETKLKDFEDKSSIQLVVATVSSLEGSDIETYANGLFRAWKLGEAKKNNGALLLVAPNERKVRIEVGYGLEGVLTDALSKIVISTAIAPRFKAGDYGGGIERGVDAVIDILSGDQSEWTKRAKVRSEGTSTALDDIMPLILFVLFVFIVIHMSRNAGGGGGGGLGGGYRRGPIIFFPPSGGSSWGGSSWGGSSGGGSWGGDGGFSGGGGSSGGGGASGDW
jgi:uncharacterized protein